MKYLYLFLLTALILFSNREFIHCQQQNETNDSTAFHSIGDSIATIIMKKDISMLQIEKTGDIFNYLGSFYQYDEGRPGGMSAVSYNGLNNTFLTFKFDSFPVKSYLFGYVDVNEFNSDVINEIKREPDLTFNFIPDKLVSPVPHTRINYNFGDYKRSYVNILFSKKLGDKSQIFLNGTKKGFPGALADYNLNAVKLYGSYIYDLKQNLRMKLSFIRNNRKYSSKNMVLDEVNTTERNERLGNVFNFYKLTLDKFKYRTFSVQEEVYFYQFDKSSQMSVLNNSSRGNEKIFGNRLRISSNKKHYTLNSEINLGGLWINGKDIKKISAHFLDTKLSAGKNISSQNALFMNTGYSYDNKRGSTYNLETNFVRALKQRHYFYTKLFYKNRRPSFSDLYWDSSLLKGNEKLLKESIAVSETGININIKKIGQLRSDIFLYNVNDPIVFNKNDEGYLEPENMNSFSTYGCTFHFNSTFSSIFKYVLDIQIEKNPDKNHYKFSPDFTVSSQIVLNNIEDYVIKKDIDSRLILSGFYLGTRRILDFNNYPQAFYLNSENPQNSFLLNFKAIAKIKTMKIYFELFNILSSNHQKLSLLYMPEMYRRWGVEWEFYN